MKAWFNRKPADGKTRLLLNRLARLAVRSGVIAACACAMPAPTAAEPQDMPRVRDNGDPSIGALIREATGRSATFRRLVETIDATDGIVYVEHGKCRLGAQAYMMPTVTLAGPHRVLRIVVNKRRHPTAVMAAIGHELRHAVEVLHDRGVTSDHAIYFFYQREGYGRGARFETAAAVRAGSQVFDELTGRPGDGRPIAVSSSRSRQRPNPSSVSPCPPAGLAGRPGRFSACS